MWAGTSGKPAAVFRVAVLFGCVLLLEWYSGAFGSSTRGDNPDEPAHIVTGLMVRDYLLHGLDRAPMDFARDYYVHYPKVGMGQWPPVFYAEQAVWMLLFPPGRPSLLVLMAFLTALVAAGTFSILCREYGQTVAWCACLVMLTLPGIARDSTQIMTEISQALMILGAMLAFAKYLDSGKWQDAAAFGVWSSVSLLTKGTGLVLAPVPLLAVLLTRRWELLRRFSFWLPVAIVALVAGPWYLLAPSALHERTMAFGGPGLVTPRMALPPWVWAGEFGWVISSLALIGLLLHCVRSFVGRLPGVWTTAASLAICGTLFPFFFYVWETRHETEVAPAIVILAVAGGNWLYSRMGIRLPAVPGAILMVLAAVAVGSWNLAHVYRQIPSNYAPLAEAIVKGEAGTIQTLLIAANSVGEGSLISEIAQREPQPSRYVLRATKLLDRLTWMGAKKTGEEAPPRFRTPAELNTFLTALPVDMVVVDRATSARLSYGPLLQETLQVHAGAWRLWRKPQVNARFEVFLREGTTTVSPAVLRQRLAEAGLEPAP